jgi:hypothetical protein
MVSGKPVTIEEIDATLGSEIYMYRLSTYIWHIKTIANGVVKAIKDGRKVTAYQIINVEEVKSYMKRAGVLSANFVPGQTQKRPSISKLADLQADPLPAKVESVEEVVNKVVQKVTEQKTDELVVTEITE